MGKKFSCNINYRKYKLPLSLSITEEKTPLASCYTLSTRIATSNLTLQVLSASSLLYVRCAAIREDLSVDKCGQPCFVDPRFPTIFLMEGCPHLSRISAPARKQFNFK